MGMDTVNRVKKSNIKISAFYCTFVMSIDGLNFGLFLIAIC